MKKCPICDGTGKVSEVIADIIKIQHDEMMKKTKSSVSSETKTGE